MLAIEPTSQSSPWPRSQKKHLPHWGTQEITMWSPTFRWSTSSPSSVIVPAPSWPRIGREADRQRAVHDREVGVAHAGGAELDPDLPGLGTGEVDVEDLERCTDRLCDCGLRHGGSPCVRRFAVCSRDGVVATSSIRSVDRRGRVCPLEVGIEERSAAAVFPLRGPHPVPEHDRHREHDAHHDSPTTTTRTTPGEKPATTPTAKPMIATSSAR